MKIWIRKIKITQNRLSVILFMSVFLIMSGSLSLSAEKVKIEYFGRDDCKNCINLKEFLGKISKERDDLEVVEYEIDKNNEAKGLFDEVTEKLKLVKGTPIIYVNERVIQGYNTADTTGQELIKEINGGLEKGKNGQKIPTLMEFVENGNFSNVAKDGAICEINGVCEIPGGIDKDKQVIVNIPFINKPVDLTNYSLPLMSVVLGTIDGFNPCAMWVLVLFLTALIAVGNKVKMFRVAGLFILAEAVMYYLILTAWLYTWDFVGLDKWITPIVGVVAVVGGIFFISTG